MFDASSAWSSTAFGLVTSFELVAVDAVINKKKSASHRAKGEGRSAVVFEDSNRHST